MAEIKRKRRKKPSAKAFKYLPITAVMFAAALLIGISVFLTFIAGLVPSSIAAKKDPVEALRTE